MSATANTNAHSADAPHAVPPAVLFGIYGALMVLTGLTVAVTGFDLGSMNIWVAMAVAVVKAGLVLLYFMHLRWDSPFYAVAMVCCFVFLGIFIAFAMSDASRYQPVMDRPPAVNLP